MPKGMNYSFTLNSWKKKYTLMLALLFFSSLVSADYVGNTNIKKIRVHDTVTLVGFDPQPANTCSNWGEYIKFDHRTETGKAYLSTFLSAKMSGKPVQLWYIASSAPGTNQTNGCYDGTTSTLTGVGIP
ncbi:MAG TPA: hypothetical protein VIM41_08795 [Gammaproteobacteria bacterium]